MSNQIQEMVEQATVEVLPMANGNGNGKTTALVKASLTADQAMQQVGSVPVKIDDDQALAMHLKACQKALNAVYRQAAEDRLGLRPAGTKRR